MIKIGGPKPRTMLKTFFRKSMYLKSGVLHILQKHGYIWKVDMIKDIET